jgi:hypothetical protein
MLEIDNLIIEHKLTLNGETVYHVRNINTDEVYFISNTLASAIDYAESKVAQ